MMRLYELAIADGRSISPFVWRSKFVLARRGLDYETQLVGFTDIPGLFEGRFRTVPVLEHDATVLNESGAIADYLDTLDAPGPKIFDSPQERGSVRLFEAYFADALRRAAQIYVPDIAGHVREPDRDYFVQSRETRFGESLSAMSAAREARLPEFRKALEPLRRVLADQAWLGGEAPGYADYIVLAAFIWIDAVATIPSLAAGDPLAAYLARGFDLHCGIGHAARS